MILDIIRNKILIIICLVLFGFQNTNAQDYSFLPIKLSDDAEISLLIAAPGEEDVWTVYGHAGIGVKDTNQGIDITFNYGIFSFTNDFVFKFIKGDTDYMLMPFETRYYIESYLALGRDVYDLKLDLREDEKQKMWQKLLWNIKEENRIYRYNFFYNNCSTKPMEIIKEISSSKFIYPKDMKQNSSWRDMINFAERNKKWLLLGTDLALGEKTDSIPNIEESFFLPDNVIQYLPKIRLQREDGSIDPLIKSIDRIKSNVEPIKSNNSILSRVLSPITLAMLMLIISAISLKKSILSKNIRNKTIDIIYLSLGALAGLILFYISFISSHPHVFPNYNLLYLNPLYLIGLSLLFIKNINKMYYYYHFLIFVLISLFFLSQLWIIQTFSDVQILIALSYYLLSISRIVEYYRHIYKKN